MKGISPKRIHDDSGDETEDSINWLNQFIEKIQYIIRDVSGDVQLPLKHHRGVELIITGNDDECLTNIR